MPHSGYTHQKIGRADLWKRPAELEAMNLVVARRVRDAREAKGLSVQAISDVLGVQEKVYRGWERGVVPRRETRIRLARALGIEPLELFPESELTEKEIGLLYTFRGLPEGMRERILSFLYGVANMIAGDHVEIEPEIDTDGGE